MRTLRDIARPWLSPSVFEDEDRTHAAWMLYALLGFGLGNSLLLLSRVSAA